MNFKLTPFVFCLVSIMTLGLSACNDGDNPLLNDPSQPDNDNIQISNPVIPQPEVLTVDIDNNNVANLFDTVTFTAKAGGLDNTSDVNYSWNFGDGSSGTGESTSHVYDTAGNYTVTLTATDSATGQSVTQVSTIKIVETIPKNESIVLVSVKNKRGTGLIKADVTIDGDATQTADTGFAIDESVNADDSILITAAAKGYITQSVKLEPSKTNDARSIALTLKTQEPNQPITDISTTNNINYQNMTVSFDNDSFITPDGNTATGDAEVTITEWNPKNKQDMSAFLGDGVAIDNAGEYTQLLSYGAMTVEFTQNGKKLQLAPGKYATISMKLPFDEHYEGSEIKEGDTIPMWYFAEDKAVWVQEDELMGTVVVDNSGTLRLEAQVFHFTTWNWDIKGDATGTIQLNCELSDGTGVPCYASASFKNRNNWGTVVTKASHIPVEGAEIIRIDPNLNGIDFSAYYYDVDNNLLYSTEQWVNVNEPATLVLNERTYVDNSKLKFINVKCKLPTGDVVNCTSGTAKVTYTNNYKDYQQLSHLDSRIELETAQTDQTLAAGLSLFSVIHHDQDNQMLYFTSATDGTGLYIDLLNAGDEVVIELEKSVDMTDSAEHANLNWQCSLASNATNATLEGCSLSSSTNYANSSGKFDEISAYITSDDDKLNFEDGQTAVNLDFYGVYGDILIDEGNGNTKTIKLGCKVGRSGSYVTIPNTGILDLDIQIEFDYLNEEVQLTANGIEFEAYSCRID